MNVNLTAKLSKATLKYIEHASVFDFANEADKTN